MALLRPSKENTPPLRDPVEPPSPMIESSLYSIMSDYEDQEYFNCMINYQREKALEIFGKSLFNSKFFKRKSKSELAESLPAKSQKKNESSSNQTMEVNLENLPADPGLHHQILSYHPNVQDQVRRAYLQKEYSIKKYAAFCLCCYLFKPDIGEQSGGESFVGVGFLNWKKKDRLQIHVRGPNSAHNKAWRSCEVLLNRKQHIETILSKHSNQDRIDYGTRLSASVGVSRILLQQGLPFRGHDESENSTNQGNFLAFLRWLCHFNDNIKAVTLKIAYENMKLTSPDIQKDISNAISTKIINVIIRDIGDSLFAILVDESCDMSSKEQMAIVLHYVDKGQLQLALIAVAKKHSELTDLFTMVSNVVNVVGASAKRRDMLREKHVDAIFKALNNNELLSGQGLNQETNLKRSSDTQWSSHYNCLISLEKMFPFVTDVLKIVRTYGSGYEQKFEAKVLLTFMQSFSFIFGLHLMKRILGITNDLSQALQKKDQDIVNAMDLVKICKGRLQSMRDNGWDSLLD
ncbi:zinc finger MYM-type protein 1-like [Prunus avium]|uniref:Zinc finger MYM-type protein 1-like n=1 Tax=Prunus avium TaxID=42229 RepID=A0A6P5U698_PRUAV|nr:zinc finger MYM-type protein 1-like [Prunus avium]